MPRRTSLASPAPPSPRRTRCQPDQQIRRTRWDIKIDHQFSSNHKIYGRYSQAHHRAWKGDHQAQFGWLDLDPNAQPQPVEHYNGVISDTMILSPTFSNEFRGGYNRREVHNGSLFEGQNWAQKLAMFGLT